MNFHTARINPITLSARFSHSPKIRTACINPLGVDAEGQPGGKILAMIEDRLKAT
jgi:hypothetical protein